MSKMTPAGTLTRAAKMLEQLAQDIYHCNTFDDQWIEGTDSERADYDELLDLADRLRRVAEG